MTPATRYVPRQLFRNLVTDKRLVQDLPRSDGGLSLFSEDFRPANALLDRDLCIAGLIGWEFTYTAPALFNHDPPWWLLIEEPDYWTGGYDAWMEAEEEKMAAANPVNKLGDRGTGVLLSRRMRESWEKRTWMLNYAARKGWAFDFIWWKFPNERFFGLNENQDFHSGLELLCEPQRAAMEALCGAQGGGEPEPGGFQMGRRAYGGLPE